MRLSVRLMFSSQVQSPAEAPWPTQAIALAASKSRGYTNPPQMDHPQMIGGSQGGNPGTRPPFWGVKS